MAFGWFKRRGKEPTAEQRVFGAGRAPRLSLPAQSERRRPPRPEEPLRVALAELADAVRLARATGEARGRALAIAGIRDALESVALAGEDPAVLRACSLFGDLLGSATASDALRLEAAQLALETLALLAVPGPGEQRDRATVAIGVLERAAERARAA